jgi:hypothetical protein
MSRLAFQTNISTDVIFDSPDSGLVKSKLDFGWEISQVVTRHTGRGTETLTVLVRVDVFSTENSTGAIKLAKF